MTTVEVSTVSLHDALPILGGISVTDVDGNLSTVQLAVANGTVTVTLSGTATISAGGNGTATRTPSGSPAANNASLASLAYKGTLNYNGPDTLTVTSRDSNAVTDVDTVAITVLRSEERRVGKERGAQVVKEDTANAVGGVSGTDGDGNLSTAQLAVAGETENAR